MIQCDAINIYIKILLIQYVIIISVTKFSIIV